MHDPLHSRESLARTSIALYSGYAEARSDYYCPTYSSGRGDCSIHFISSKTAGALLNMLLQPIIENAIDHGLDLKTDGRGELCIAAQRQGDEIIVTIADNGPGFDKVSPGEVLERDSNGYGLKNVNQRLTMFYGREYGLQIRSQPLHGTIVTIRIPYTLPSFDSILTNTDYK